MAKVVVDCLVVGWWYLQVSRHQGKLGRRRQVVVVVDLACGGLDVVVGCRHVVVLLDWGSQEQVV
jgi:hypothetical protein